jgi:hypothetical protein
VKASTPAGDPATDSPTDPTGRHGDVDTNGDLVDQLDERLRGAITATTDDLAEAQPRCVRQVVAPWTVTP